MSSESAARDFCGEALASAGATPNRGDTSERNDRRKPDGAGHLAATHKQEQAWPSVDQGAYYGHAGDVARTIDPHTEADPVAILIQTLAHLIHVGSDLH